jgi:hypothetical protein
LLATDSPEEAPMCHRGYVLLSPEEKQDVKKLSGVMIPVYASVLVALIAFVVFTGGSRQGELIASRATPAATR